jgi:hypothetical protein
MLPAFDIFRVETDGQLVWKGTADTLDLARLRIKILMLSQPGDDEMLRHIREDKCEQCKAVVQYFDREAEIELYLRNSWN